MIQRQARNVGNMGRIPSVYRSKSARLNSHWVIAVFLPMLLSYPLNQATELTALPKKDASQLSGNTEPLANIHGDRMQSSRGSNCPSSVNGPRMKRGANENDVSVPYERRPTWNSLSWRNISPDDRKRNHSSTQTTRNEVDHERVFLLKPRDAGSTSDQNTGHDLASQPRLDPSGNHHEGYRPNFRLADLSREAGINEINNTAKQTRLARSSPTNKPNYSITRSNETRSEKRSDADSNRQIRENGSGSDARGRPLRSPNEEVSGAPAILPNNCEIPWSCSKRASMNMTLDGDPNVMRRAPCRCDADCVIYGDCCADGQTSQSANDEGRAADSNHKMDGLGKEKERILADEEKKKLNKMEVGVRKGHSHNPPTSWTCGHLASSKLRQVYMVNKCPDRAPKELSDKCERVSVENDPQRYLMDIPVVSQNSDIVYSNDFCAKCHNDFTVKEYNVTVRCTGNITSLEVLRFMTYHPGELKWSEKDLEKASPEHPPRAETTGITCSLDVSYNDVAGRICEIGLIENCQDSWGDEDIKIKCSSYNYYVEVGRKVYKNWHCALCNDEPEHSIKCLSPYFIQLVSWPLPSLTDLFSASGHCEENQVWNIIYSKCENVSCGSRFTLKEGRCVPNNGSLENGSSQSFLNSTCYTREFLLNDSLLFPNGSVYLNPTKETYVTGEYEFVDDTWIKICRPADMWTPVMNVISTVLISISLICMVVHVVIFALLPKRRNIPSMNLCSMTLSLFVSELVFVALFYFNENYPLCVVIAIIIYYFLTSSFLWMNVMSIDICRTFHSQTYKTKSRKIFIQYSVYAWCAPMAATVIALLTDQFADSDFILNPQFGTQRCWFNKKWGLVAFFTLPSGLIVLVNLGLFGVSVYDIYKQHKSGEFASATVQRNGNSVNKTKEEKEKEKFLKPTYSGPNLKQSDISIASGSESPRCAERFRERIQRRIHANKKQRVRLVLYCKLAIIMGLTWIFAFVSFHTESLVFEYLFIVFNGLQGTFIFIAFDCKQKIWDELYTKITGKKVVRKSTESSFNTKETPVTSSTDGQYKYRWSSNRNQDGSRKSSPIPQPGPVAP